VLAARELLVGNIKSTWLGSPQNQQQYLLSKGVSVITTEVVTGSITDFTNLLLAIFSDKI